MMVFLYEILDQKDAEVILVGLKYDVQHCIWNVRKLDKNAKKCFLQGWQCTYSCNYVLYENYISVESQEFQLNNFQEPKIVNFKLPCEILLTLTLT